MGREIELYERLKPKLGEEEARLLLSYVADTVRLTGATKEDLLQVEMRLGERISAVEKDLREEILRLEMRMKNDFWKVKVGLAAAILLSPTVQEWASKLLALLK